MNRMRNRAVRVGVFALLLLAAVSTSLVSAPSLSSPKTSEPQETMGPCRCSDLKALFNRKAEVEKASATLETEFRIVEAAHLGDKTDPMYNDSTDRHLFADDIQKAIDSIHDRTIAEQTKNMTFPPDCESSVQGATGCLHEAAKAGEAVYMEFCKERQQSLSTVGAIISGKGWQERTSLLRLLYVASQAYDAEANFINKEINRLKPYCKTNGWTGKVLVSFVETYHDTDPGSGATPIPTTVDYEDRRDVTINVFDGKSYAELSAGYTYKKVRKGSFDADCGKRKVPSTVDQTQTIERHGDVFSLPLYFSINVDRTGSYRISGQVSGGPGFGTATSTNKGTGGCDPNAKPAPNSSGPLPKENSTVPGVDFHATGKAVPNALVLDDKDLPLDLQQMLGHKTRVIKVEWHLTRAKP